MSGKIKILIDSIIDQRANGNSFLMSTTKAKIALKGIDPDKYNHQSDDDPVIIEKLINLAENLKVRIG
jgi:hypothetical protein